MEINAIDYYNQTQWKEALALLQKNTRTLKEVSRCKFGIKLNKNDNDVFLLLDKDTGNWTVIDDNPMALPKGQTLSNFEILIRFKHKGSIWKATMDVQNRFGANDLPFIRVGINYFKVTQIKDIDGITRQKLLPWNKMEIKEDYGKDSLVNMPRYDGFIMRPDNVNFQQVVDNMYNIYQPFAHIPEACTDFEKECPWSHRMLKHVFQEQYELGLIYMQVKYLHPMQSVPILGLVSRENQTGKSTFANWIQMIFGANASIIDINSFGSDFTEAFAERNIVVIEETKSKDEKIMNKLKALSTQKKLLVNKKNISMYDTDFFCSFIINSNHENNFLRIDREDIRYWVRKLPKLPKDNANHNIEKDLLNEIPKLLGYLQGLPAVDFSRSRMVFTEEEIRTDQLEKVKESSKTGLYTDIKQRAEDFLADHPDYECLEFSITDIKDHWYKNVSNYDSKYIKKTLEDEMSLTRTKSRQRYRSLGHTGSNTKDKTGFFYTLRRDHFEDWDLKTTEEETKDDCPF